MKGRDSPYLCPSEFLSEEVEKSFVGLQMASAPPLYPYREVYLASLLITEKNLRSTIDGQIRERSHQERERRFEIDTISGEYQVWSLGYFIR